jgi:hypothetical protein
MNLALASDLINPRGNLFLLDFANSARMERFIFNRK